jgi:YidC/Oxa1 family membrane protein insertase
MKMLAAYPWSPLFQGLLDAIGAVLAWLYGIVGNYGVSIIILTVLIRVILLPLGVKQIKSMQAMQAIQPKVKEIQKKYKTNKTKAQEETMKLYRESGVNPLGGCLPLLLQFPILISMYAVIRAPTLDPVVGPRQTGRFLRSEEQPPPHRLDPVSACDQPSGHELPLDEPPVFGCPGGVNGGTERRGQERDPGWKAAHGSRVHGTGRNLPWDARLWPQRARQDPVLRDPGLHDRHDLLPAATDDEGESRGCPVLAAAGDPEVHAA